MKSQDRGGRRHPDHAARIRPIAELLLKEKAIIAVATPHATAVAD